MTFLQPGSTDLRLAFQQGAGLSKRPWSFERLSVPPGLPGPSHLGLGLLSGDGFAAIKQLSQHELARTMVTIASNPPWPGALVHLHSSLSFHPTHPECPSWLWTWTTFSISFPASSFSGVLRRPWDV